MIHYVFLSSKKDHQFLMGKPERQGELYQEKVTKVLEYLKSKEIGRNDYDYI